MDVITLLKKDHKMVKELFKECEKLKGRTGQKKSDLIALIKQALTVHAQVEEELVYPAFMENRSMKDQVNEALEEHHVTKMLLAELDELQPDDQHYDAKVKVLCEYLMHHVKEEEKEMFPEAEKRLSSKRLMALGEEVEARRNELMGGDEKVPQHESNKMKDQDMEDIQDMKKNKGGNVARGKSQLTKRRAA
jgi:hemerythrin superfamily protein